MNGGMSKIAATDKRGYFQFPLCLLAFGEDYKQRLQHLMSYCVYEQAKRSNPKFPRSARNRLLDEAATFLRVPIGSHENRMRQWKEADSFVREWEQRYGKDANVRIGTSLLWEAKDDSGVSYREFSILCAINSIIGKRRSIPKRITVPSVQARAAGFKSWDLLKSACSDESGKARLLTIDQVRYTLDNLHIRNFFARARVGAKTVKYMLGVTDEELRAILERSETYRSRFKTERAKKDAELMAAIRSARQRPINASKEQIRSVSVPTESRHHNGMIPDINICSFNNGTRNTSGRNTAPLSQKSGSVDLLKKEKLKKLDRSQFTAEELAFIDLFHAICLPSDLGFLPVTQRSTDLDKVLENFAAGFDEEEWTGNFRDAVKQRRGVFRTSPCKYNTLVQICWKLNY